MNENAVTTQMIDGRMSHLSESGRYLLLRI